VRHICVAPFLVRSISLRGMRLGEKLRQRFRIRHRTFDGTAWFSQLETNPKVASHFG
jgi:hypothetical protein